MFITSRGTDASGRSAKVLDVDMFKSLLQEIGFEQVDIVQWWRWFDRVTAHKPGEFSPASSGSILDVLVCENCHKTHFEIIPDTGLKCSNCGNEISKNTNDVYLT